MALRLSGGEQVFEVGTGYGYQTALLARLAAFVTSIGMWSDLAATARRNLASVGVGNVRVLDGDGTGRAAEFAAYEAVLVSGAFPEVRPALVDQLNMGGRLVQPIGPGGGENVILFERTAHGLV